MKEIVVQYLLEAAVFVGLFIVGCIMIIVMTNKQIKTWIKTFMSPQRYVFEKQL